MFKILSQLGVCTVACSGGRNWFAAAAFISYFIYIFMIFIITEINYNFVALLYEIFFLQAPYDRILQSCIQYPCLLHYVLGRDQIVELRMLSTEASRSSGISLKYVQGCRLHRYMAHVTCYLDGGWRVVDSAKSMTNLGCA